MITVKFKSIFATLLGGGDLDACGWIFNWYTSLNNVLLNHTHLLLGTLQIQAPFTY